MQQRRWAVDRRSLGARLPVDLLTALEAAAHQDGCSVAALLDDLLRPAMESRGLLGNGKPAEAESPAPAPDGELLTLTEAAGRLGLSRQRVHVLVQGGRLRAERDGRRVLLPAAEVERFQRERQARR